MTILRSTLDPAAEDARSHLGPDRYDDALDTGRGFTVAQAAAMLRDPDPDPDPDVAAG